MKKIFSGTLKSGLEMYRCLYEWNSFPTHFVADDNSDVTIQDSRFINNAGISTILDMKNNLCLIEGCLFKGNMGLDVNLLDARSSNVTFINSVFSKDIGNPNIGIVSMESDYVELNNYLEIDNCTFSGRHENWEYLVSVMKVADVSIQRSYFQCSCPGMIHISKATTVRIASSRYVASNQEILFLQTMNFYTFKSSFGNKTWSITTNETDFV